MLVLHIFLKNLLTAVHNLIILNCFLTNINLIPSFSFNFRNYWYKVVKTKFKCTQY